MLCTTLQRASYRACLRLSSEGAPWTGGTLEAGTDADLILVQGHPLDDIAVLYGTESIRVVVRAGRVEFADKEFRQHLHPGVQ